jgi:hypothetical protein
MAENELEKDGEEVAVPLTPGLPAAAFDPLEEPRYGWVVCIAMHLINGFTWGIIAVCNHVTRDPRRELTVCVVLRGIPIVLH